MIRVKIIDFNNNNKVIEKYFFNIDIKNDEIDEIDNFEVKTTIGPRGRTIKPPVFETENEDSDKKGEVCFGKLFCIPTYALVIVCIVILIILFICCKCLC